MNFNPQFFDDKNLLRTRRITEYGILEIKPAFNGHLYSSYLVTLLRLCGLPFEVYRYAIQLAYVGNDFSHDDMTGIVCAKIRPINLKFSRYWYRTELWLYLFSQNKTWAKLFFPFLSIKMIWSCVTKNKAKNGALDTDGPLLAWIILENFNFPITKKICYYFLKIHFGEKYLTKMFDIKFSGNEFTTNEDHPCRLVSRELEK